jgi:hypothetical protein
MWKSRRRFQGLAGAAALSASLALAGQPQTMGMVVFPADGPQSQSPVLPENAGLGNAILSIHAYSFTPIDSSITYTHAGGTRYRTGGGDQKWFNAQVNLPTGARIDQVAFEVFQNDPGSTMAGGMFVCDDSPAGGACALAGVSGVGGTPGWTYFLVGGLDITIDNFNNSYYVEINAGDSLTNAQQFRRAVVYYRLQVSPAPVTASFGDVPTGHPFFQFVEALKASGITGGCGSGNYCPDNPVTRGQMAVFLSKALGLYWPN